MSRQPEPLFLARRAYRRRRLGDAARILPFLAAFLFLAPTLWADRAGTSQATVYLFVVWFLLILISAAVARRLEPQDDLTGPEDPEGEGGDEGP